MKKSIPETPTLDAEVIQRAVMAFGGNIDKDTLNNLSADTLKNLSAYTLNNLSADTLKNLSAYTLKNLSAYTLNNLSADTLNNLSAYTLKNLSAYTLNNLSAYTLNNLSADTLKNLSAYTLNNLSADTLKNLSAYTLKNLSAYTLKKINALKNIWADVPFIPDMYTTILSDIETKKRVLNQSDFGPYEDPGPNLCGTPMCTAGNIVNLAGAWGYRQIKEWGFPKTAAMLHIKAHPDMPTQDFGTTPGNAGALAFIKLGAAFEARKNKKQKFIDWLKSVSPKGAKGEK